MRDSVVENHEKEKKQRVGMEGAIRGRNAASLDARGAAMGSIGLVVFAIIVWQFLAGHPAWFVLAGATLTWLIVSVVLWKLRKNHTRIFTPPSKLGDTRAGASIFRCYDLIGRCFGSLSQRFLVSLSYQECAGPTSVRHGIKWQLSCRCGYRWTVA